MPVTQGEDPSLEYLTYPGVLALLLNPVFQG